MATKKEKPPVDLGTLDMIPRTAVCPTPFNQEDVTLGVHTLYEGVNVPQFATKSSGCFDLEVYLGDALTHVKAHNSNNQEFNLKIRQDPDESRYVLLNPGDRVMLPTGLVFDIPPGHSLNVIPRSSTGWKHGLGMPHSIGYIDEDYVNECFVVLKNETSTVVRVDHRARLAQASLIRYEQPSFHRLVDRPASKTDRVGGFGSTNRGNR